MDGQLSIFDFPEFLPQEPKEEKRIPKISQTTAIYYTELLRGSGFKNGKTRIYSFFQQEKNSKKRVIFLKKEYGEGGRTGKGYTTNHNANGIDIEYKTPIGKCTASHYGWPMVEKAIQELITLGVYMDDDFEVPWITNEELMGIPKQIKENVCSHSNHTCNKEELWKIADTFDDINCEHVCCRACSVRGCGARCNGSTEPLPEKCFSCRHIMGKDGCYLKECVFEPKLSCEGCIDHKKRKYKGTMCLKGCIRYCYNLDVIVGAEPDYWREE